MAAETPSREASEAPYRAFGAEPSWSLTIGDGRMFFEPTLGRPITVAAPVPETTEISRTYETDRLAVDIIVGASCSDGMSGRRFTDSVYVRSNGREFEGCGGAILAADDLNDTSWAFVEIGGEAIVPRLGIYSLDFGPDGFLGYSACNRFGGTYTRTGNTLTFGPMRATRRGCPAPHDEHERRLFQIFSGPVAISFDGPRTLVLTGAGFAARLRRDD